MECVHACRGHAGSVDCVAINEERDKVSGSQSYPHCFRLSISILSLIENALYS